MKVRKLRPGFSLVELLVVMAIILILMGIIIGTFTSVQNKQGESVARAEVNALALLLEQYKARYGSYPLYEPPFGTEGNLLYRALMDEIYPDGTNNTGEQRPFLDESFTVVIQSSDEVLVDPWGNPYIYRYADTSGSWINPGFILLSAGGDAIFNFGVGVFETGYDDAGLNLFGGSMTGDFNHNDHFTASDLENVDNIIYGVDY